MGRSKIPYLRTFFFGPLSHNTFTRDFGIVLSQSQIVIFENSFKNFKFEWSCLILVLKIYLFLLGKLFLLVPVFLVGDNAFFLLHGFQHLFLRENLLLFFEFLPFFNEFLSLFLEFLAKSLFCLKRNFIPFQIFVISFKLMFLKPVFLQSVKSRLCVHFRVINRDSISVEFLSFIKPVKQVFLTFIITIWKMKRHILFKIFFGKSVLVYSFLFLLLEFLFQALLD